MVLYIKRKTLLHHGQSISLKDHIAEELKYHSFPGIAIQRFM
jgi:hypothetical protein